MKKLSLLILLLGSVELYAQEGGLAAAVPFSLVYAQDFSPGLGGFFLTADYQTPLEFLPSGLQASFGLEYGVSPLGSQILFPVGLVFKGVHNFPWDLDWYGRIHPGLTLTKPRPLFLIGGEAGFRGGWYPEKSWGLVFSLGVRYSACPEYSFLYALYSQWEVPLALGIRWKFS